ncbi:F0F1 ATP synthase subunit A [bacterium]|nr:F0F1 ATP synthase subunit A [bacterium]
MDKKEKNLLKTPGTVKDLTIGMFYYTSTSIFGPLLIFIPLGFFLDKHFQTKPWITLISILLAFIITNILIFRKIRKLMKKFKKEFPKEQEINKTINQESKKENMDNISLSPQILFYIGQLPITNTLFWSIILTLFLITIFLFLKKSMKESPNRWQNLFEIIFEGAYSFVKSIIGDDKKAKRAFPLVFTMFIFILTANLATFIPGQAAITIKTTEGNMPLFRAVMSDYGLVFMMTILSVLVTQIVAIIVHGPFGYIGKFINLSGIKEFFQESFKGKFKFGILAQGLLDFFLGIMDIIGELAKIVSLSFRLFGNMFASEVLSAVILFLAPFIAPLPFQFLGLLTAIVQAFVFSVLTLIFISMASEINEDELIEKVTI